MSKRKARNDPKSSAAMAAAAARKAIGSSGRITFLTGAGISAESGLSTFRDAGGLWEKFRIEEVASPEGFARNPKQTQDFYNARRRNVQDAKPNLAHHALARLEAALGDRVTLITQNVDDLHERGGSKRVLHMHGELLKARCVSCEHVIQWTQDITPSDACPRCGQGLRPHIVWFGEIPFYYDKEIPRALQAEVFVSIGTSGTVYPAAGMVEEAMDLGSLRIELNLEPSLNHVMFDFCVLGPAATTVPAFVDTLLAPS